MRAHFAPKPARSLAPVCHDLSIAGELLGLHDSGALWWPDENTLIVADLHLEKTKIAADKTQGRLPHDTGIILERLAAVIDAFEPQRVIALGDSFVDHRGADRLLPCYRAMLTTLQLGREWIWVTGHDNPVAPIGLCGETVDLLRISGLCFRDRPGPDEERLGEISASMYPAAKIRRYARSVRRACFATDGERLVLPAFGFPYGGVNVMDEAWSDIFPFRGFSVFLLGEGRLYPFTATKLIAD